MRRGLLLVSFLEGKSIHSKIFAALLLVILLTLVSVIPIWYIESSNKIKDNTLKYVTDNIQRSNDNLDIMMRDINKISTIIASNVDVVSVLQTSYEKPTYRWFKDLVGIKGFLDTLMLYEQTNISGITVIDKDMNLYWAGAPHIPNNIMDTDWIKKIIGSNGKEVILIRDTISGEKIITLGRAILRSAVPIGIVFIDIDYDIIQRNFDIDLLENSRIFLIDENGDFIYHPNGLENEQNIQSTQYYKAFINKTLQDKQHIYIYNKSQCTGWTTIGVITKGALGKNAANIRNQTILVGIFVFIIALFVSMLVSNQITKNLKQLRDTMKLVEGGNLSAIPKINSKDEVGELSKSFTKMMSKIKELMDSIKEHERTKREIEFKALQATINPHFLYNTLNTIKYLADGQNVKNISELTTSLIVLLQTTIGKGTEYITIQEELDHVKAYLNIQKFKYLNKFSTVFEVEDEVLKYKVLKMTLQPIVENALIHGIEPLEYNGIISIKIYKETDAIKFKVTDNGVGMSKEQVKRILEEQDKKHSRFSGIGLKNVNERIKLLFGEQYGLQVYSELGLYTTVEVKIPVLE